MALIFFHDKVKVLLYFGLKRSRENGAVAAINGHQWFTFKMQHGR